MRVSIIVILKFATALASATGIAAARAEDAVTMPAPEQSEAAAEAEAVINYCLNISDKAKDARVARQTAALRDIESQVEAKIKQLDQRRDELKSWIEKRRSLQDAAEKSLVEIYATMDAEAAAEQMTKLDVRLASSVLHQLKPRLASGILNEMQPEQAAKLVKFIAAASDLEKTAK
jgi:flagellar motility protein MotE (MotC chaperone)